MFGVCSATPRAMVLVGLLVGFAGSALAERPGVWKLVQYTHVPWFHMEVLGQYPDEAACQEARARNQEHGQWFTNYSCEYRVDWSGGP